MQFGAWQLDTVSGGKLRLDGGAMFGVVPKPLWEKKQPADERNRIRMATNCLLARDGKHTIVIDTGPGGKHTPRERDFLALEPGEPLLESLEALGVSAESVDLVVLTHLHFDHAGGATHLEENGRVVPTFPNARYVVQRAEWQDATGGAAELRGSYPPENFVPLEEAGQLTLIEGDVEIVPGLRSLVTPGHTRGHQSLLLESEGRTAIYVGDLCPMTAHVRSHWCMAYDTQLLETRRRKPEVLGRAADGDWLVLWDHDPDWAACRLRREKQEFAVVDPLARL